MKREIIVRRNLSDYHEVVDWCKEHFRGGNNGRYDVLKAESNSLVHVYLTTYTDEAYTLVALKWL